MAAGNLRCDLNVSLRCKETGLDLPKVGCERVFREFSERKGSSPMWTCEYELFVKVEVKNVRSLPAIRRAIAFEYSRQMREFESEGSVVSETRHWDDRLRASPPLLKSAFDASRSETTSVKRWEVVHLSKSVSLLLSENSASPRKAQVGALLYLPGDADSSSGGGRGLSGRSSVRRKAFRRVRVRRVAREKCRNFVER